MFIYVVSSEETSLLKTPEQKPQKIPIKSSRKTPKSLYNFHWNGEASGSDKESHKKYKGKKRTIFMFS